MLGHDQMDGWTATSTDPAHLHFLKLREKSLSLRPGAYEKPLNQLIFFCAWRAADIIPHTIRVDSVEDFIEFNGKVRPGNLQPLSEMCAAVAILRGW